MEQKMRKSRISNAAEKIGRLLVISCNNGFQPVTLANCAKGLGLSYLTAENLVGYTCLLFKAGINISLDIKSNEKGRKVVSVVKAKDLLEQVKKLQQLTSLNLNKVVLGLRGESSSKRQLGLKAVVERLLMQGETPISEVVSISGRKKPARSTVMKMENSISRKYGEFGFKFNKQESFIKVNGQKRSGIRKWQIVTLDIDLEKTKESTLINLGCSQESIEKFRQRTGEKDVVVKKSTTPAASFVNEVVKSCTVKVTLEVAPENLSELVSRISGLAEFSSKTEKSKVQEFIELEEKISKTLNELLNA